MLLFWRNNKIPIFLGHLITFRNPGNIWGHSRKLENALKIRHCRSKSGKLTGLYLYCSEYDEINKCHPYIQKHVFYLKRRYEKYKYFVYRLPQKFSYALHPIGGEFIKRILTYLYSTKYNEIYTGHLGLQNHISY